MNLVTIELNFVDNEVLPDPFIVDVHHSYLKTISIVLPHIEVFQYVHIPQDQWLVILTVLLIIGAKISKLGYFLFADIYDNKLQLFWVVVN